MAALIYQVEPNPDPEEVAAETPFAWGVWEHDPEDPDSDEIVNTASTRELAEQLAQAYQNDLEFQRKRRSQ